MDSCQLCKELSGKLSVAIEGWETEFHVPLCSYHADRARELRTLINALRALPVADGPKQAPARKILTDKDLAARERDIDFQRAMGGESPEEQSSEGLPQDHFRYRERMRWQNNGSTPEPSKTSPSESPTAVPSTSVSADRRAPRSTSAPQLSPMEKRRQGQVIVGQAIRQMPPSATDPPNISSSSTASPTATRTLSLKAQTKRGEKSRTTS